MYGADRDNIGRKIAQEVEKRYNMHMKNIFKLISKDLWKDTLIHAISIAVAIFLLGFFQAMGGQNVFIDIEKEVIIKGLKDGVNAVWQYVYVLIIPFLTNFIRTDKK